MPSVTEVRKIPGRLTYRYTETPGPGTPPVPRDYTRVINSEWTEGRYRWLQRNDPKGRFYHGYYSLESSKLSHIPNVFGKLAYESLVSTVKQYYTVSLEGSGFGYVIPRCRWNYAGESNRSILINNCIKGALDEKANVAVFLAELGQSSKLIANTATRFANAANAIRKGRFHKAARILKIQKPLGAKRTKAFADNLLEYQYGWVPLVVDTVGLLQHIHLRARALTIRARSRITTPHPPVIDSRQVELEREASSQHRFLATWRYDGKWETHEQVQLVFRMPSAFWDQIKSLGLSDPLPVIWETIPLSFVVDKFVNAGEYLSSLNIGLSLEYVTGSYVEFHRNKGPVSATAHWADTKPGLYKYNNIQASVTTAVFEEIRMRRTVIPWPDVAVTMQLGLPTSVNDAITATALVVQRLK